MDFQAYNNFPVVMVCCRHLLPLFLFSTSECRPTCYCWNGFVEVCHPFECIGELKYKHVLLLGTQDLQADGLMIVGKPAWYAYRRDACQIARNSVNIFQVHFQWFLF